MSGDSEWGERGAAAEAALAETWESLATVGDGLGDTEWERPTACPGWSVKDQFSHLIGIERMLLGETAPEWTGPLGDHVRNDFAVANEPWVAVRRSSAGPVVRDEFIEVTGRRLAVLAGLSEEEWAKVGFSPSGQVPYAEFMDLRVFDSWVHEQDVRSALGRPGGSGGRASALSLGRVQSAMGFVVGKKAAAPEGSVVCFDVTGAPGDARRFALGITGGRAGEVADEARAAAGVGVTLTLDAVDFTQLGCGRVTAAELEAAGRIGVAGDADLGERVLNSMNFMF
jgi:uncharacterized protein (TIGR03083 family)